MRIRITTQPASSDAAAGCFDQVQPGEEYDLGPALAQLFIARGWAQPVSFNDAAAGLPPDELGLNFPDPVPPNVHVETEQLSLTDAIAADIARDDSIARLIAPASKI